MATFNQDTSNTGATGELIPNGTLAKVSVTVRKLANAKETHGLMADTELTLVDGPYAKRKVWVNIADPDDSRHSENFRNMGFGALQRMAESIGFFDHTKPASYRDMKLADLMAVLEDASRKGMYPLIEVGIQKGKEGYSDKNQVKTWISPNPKSGTAKLIEKYEQQKVAGGGAHVAVQAGGFAAPAQAAEARPLGGGFNQAATPSWLVPPKAAEPREGGLDDEIPY